MADICYISPKQIFTFWRIFHNIFFSNVNVVNIPFAVKISPLFSRVK